MTTDKKLERHELVAAELYESRKLKTELRICKHHLAAGDRAYKQLEQQRDQLLEACNALFSGLEQAESTTDTLDALDNALPAIRAAIAACESEAK